MGNLILTGFGWSEYAVAAAVALKGLIGETDILLATVGKFFSVDVKPFAPFADEGKKVP